MVNVKSGIDNFKIMCNKRIITAVAFHFNSALTDKAPVVKPNLDTDSFKENLEFRTEMEKEHKLHLDSKIRCNLEWLKTINNLSETFEHLGKMKPIVSQSTFDILPKVKAAQIGGPDIDMEPVVDKDGNVRYLKPRR